MGKEKTKDNSVMPTIITIVIAIVAVATVLYAYITGAFGNTGSGGFIPTQEHKAEIEKYSKELLDRNYETYMLFYQYGLAIGEDKESEEEIYDRTPEDGVYTVNSDKYKTYEDIENLLKDTFAQGTVRRLLEKGQGKGQIYFDKDGKLGMKIANFEQHDYNKNWNNITIEYDDIEEFSAKLIVQLNSNDDDSESGDSTVEGYMVKINDKWVLEDLIY